MKWRRDTNGSIIWYFPNTPPPINSKVLTDIETTQKNCLFSTNFMYSTNSNLGEKKKFKEKEKWLNNSDQILKRKAIRAKFLRENLEEGVVIEWPVSSAVDRITNIKDSPWSSWFWFPSDSLSRLWFTTWDLVPLYHNFLVYIFHNITIL